MKNDLSRSTEDILELNRLWTDAVPKARSLPELVDFANRYADAWQVPLIQGLKPDCRPAPFDDLNSLLRYCMQVVDCYREGEYEGDQDLVMTALFHFAEAVVKQAQRLTGSTLP